MKEKRYTRLFAKAIRKLNGRELENVLKKLDEIAASDLEHYKNLSHELIDRAVFDGRRIMAEIVVEDSGTGSCEAWKVIVCRNGSGVCSGWMRYATTNLYYISKFIKCQGSTNNH